MDDKSDVIFVNSVMVSGFNNGVVNVALSTARFTPTTQVGEDGNVQTVVAPNEYISGNIRMDLFCAQQLHDSLARIIEQQTKPAPKDVN